MALPILALAAMAADMLQKNAQEKAQYQSKLDGIEQTRLANEGAIFQGGRASGGYGQFVQPRAEQHDSGLGAAIQLLGGALGDKSSGDDNVGKSTSLLKGLGGQNGLSRSILSDSDSEGNFVPDDKYDDGLTLSKVTVGVPKNIGDSTSLGGVLDSPSKMTDGPDDISNDFTSRMMKRIRL